MGSLLSGLFSAIKGLVSSKKFWVTVGTVASQAVVTNPGLRDAVLKSGIALVIGQGMADFGKVKAGIEAAAGAVEGAKK